MNSKLIPFLSRRALSTSSSSLSSAPSPSPIFYFCLLFSLFVFSFFLFLCFLENSRVYAPVVLHVNCGTESVGIGWFMICGSRDVIWFCYEWPYVFLSFSLLTSFWYEWFANSLSKFIKNYLHNLGHYIGHNEKSSLPLAGLPEEHPVVFDILDTCCLLLRLFQTDGTERVLTL